MNLYVSNLGFDVNDGDLQQMFAPFGAVSSAHVIKDKYTSQSRGFGFVEMPDTDAAQQAIKELDGSMADGRPLKVSEARPREDKGFNRSSKRW